MPWEKHVSVPKAFTLAVVVVLGVSIVAHAAARARAGGAAAYRNYEVQNGYGGSSAAGSYGGGGYSSDPKTRELEILADKYKPGW
jgi:uncharacterized membrane protein